jgi:hypothetical protein
VVWFKLFAKRELFVLFELWCGVVLRGWLEVVGVVWKGGVVDVGFVWCG